MKYNNDQTKIWSENDSKLMIIPIISEPEKLKNKLSNFKKYADEYDKFTSDKRKSEFLTSRIAFNLLMEDEVKVIYDLEGKPYLQNSDIHISISHSKNLLALVAHPRFVCGIDLEYKTETFRKVAHKFLSEKELNEMNPLENTDMLAVCWSAKEAIYKVIGKEVVNFSENIYIAPFIPMKSGNLTAHILPSGSEMDVKYHIEPDYVLAYCFKK